MRGGSGAVAASLLAAGLPRWSRARTMPTAQKVAAIAVLTSAARRWRRLTAASSTMVAACSPSMTAPRNGVISSGVVTVSAAWTSCRTPNIRVKTQASVAAGRPAAALATRRGKTMQAPPTPARSRVMHRSDASTISRSYAIVASKQHLLCKQLAVCSTTRRGVLTCASHVLTL
jgi:hypothetical protein